MGKSLMDKIHAKLELFRLEQRYTRRRHRRSTFVSNAVYVDGEYVYQTPSSTGSSQSSTRNVDALHGDKASVVGSIPSPGPLDTPEFMPSPQFEQPQQQQQQQATPQRKRLNRFSSMPGFGGNFSIKEMPRIEERRNSMSR